MAVFLSPGVFPREIDLSAIPTNTGALTPAFIGTAKKGPLQDPTFVGNSQQFIDIFGEPFPESFLGYAVLAYFEDGGRAWILRVGVECEEGQPDGLADICIDNSGARGKGWGRIAIFSGIDFGKICTRIVSVDAPLVFHSALVFDIDYNDIDVDPTPGPVSATLSFVSLTSYTGAIDDSFTVLITSDVPATGGSVMDGATFEVIRNSDGTTVLADIIVESGTPGTSELIDIGDGLVFAIVVTGSVPIAANDTFTFTVRPDNRTFSFNVDRQDPGSVVEYTIPDGSTYTDSDDFADDINTLISSVEPYRAISQDDDTVCFTTDVAGRNIQLISREAFSLEVGQTLYAYDIPRSHLHSTNTEPYDITTENNRVNIEVVGQASTVEIEFSITVGLNQSGAAIANAIHLGGIKTGERYWRSFAMLIPGGETHVFIETVVDHQFDQLKMQADGSHFKTLRFAEELGIQFPYTRAYQVFSDSRVLLPDAGTVTPNTPLSCEVDAFSDECAADSGYFANIVGWLVAKSAGTWVDDFKVTLDIFGAGEGAGDVAGRFKVTIEDKNNQTVDAFEDVTFDPRDERYIGNVINEGSQFGGPNGNSFVQWIPRPAFLNNDPVNDPDNFEVRVPGSFSRKDFTGSANGIPADPSFSSELDRSVIGNPNLETGIFAFQNPEVFDISLLIIPGFSSGAVIGQGLRMCETRGDCLFIIDPPFGLRAQQVVDWHNGILFSDLAQAINSSYGALYHPWLKLFDQFNGGTIFTPPSGHVSGVYARTERVAETWFAPAGVNRGRLLTPLDTEVDLSMGERDLMYGSGNAVNAIVNFPQDGITVWGQRTLQRRATALDRVNVRMLLIFIKKNAINFLRQFVFEPNDKITRARVANVSSSFLADIQARRGLTGFSVVCDDRNNTPERIDRNELHVAYFLKPTRAAEFIQLNLVVLRTEASFSSEAVLQAGGVVLATQ
jgi:hypothetical protein